MIDQYKGPALIALFDCVGIMAQCSTNLALHVDQLMPLLAKKWVVFACTDKRLLPLMECFETVISQIGAAATPFVGPVFSRCVSILEKLDQIDSGWADDFINRSL